MHTSSRGHSTQLFHFLGVIFIYSQEFFFLAMFQKQENFFKHFINAWHWRFVSQRDLFMLKDFLDWISKCMHHIILSGNVILLCPVNVLDCCSDGHHNPFWEELSNQSYIMTIKCMVGKQFRWTIMQNCRGFGFHKWFMQVACTHKKSAGVLEASFTTTNWEHRVYKGCAHLHVQNCKRSFSPTPLLLVASGMTAREINESCPSLSLSAIFYSGGSEEEWASSPIYRKSFWTHWLWGESPPH